MQADPSRLTDQQVIEELHRRYAVQSKPMRDGSVRLMFRLPPRVQPRKRYRIAEDRFSGR